MAGRRKDVLDIREMVRRFRLGERNRRIARDLAVSRNTAAKYRESAREQGQAPPKTSPVPASSRRSSPASPRRRSASDRLPGITALDRQFGTTTGRHVACRALEQDARRVVVGSFAAERGKGNARSYGVLSSINSPSLKKAPPKLSPPSSG